MVSRPYRSFKGVICTDGFQAEWVETGCWLVGDTEGWYVVFGIFLAALLLAPLLLIGCYVAADRLGWPVAGRIVDIIGAILMSQFVIGASVNIALGIVMVGLAIWTARHFGSA